MTIKRNEGIVTNDSCQEDRSSGKLFACQASLFKRRGGFLSYAWIGVAFSLMILTSSMPTCAQTFSDDFNRPDGTIGNDWGSWNGSTLVNGQLQTFGSNGVGGGIFRAFPVTLPLKFSLDFRSESPHPPCDIGNNLPGGGWLIAFNAPGAGYAGAQIEFLQFYGSQFILRQYQTAAGTFADILPSASPDFGPTFVHLSGTVNRDLSATLTIGSVTYNFPPVASPLAAAPGSNLVVSNSSCGGGPFFFDNLSVTSGCQVERCGVGVHGSCVTHRAGPPLSLDGKNTSMNATFVPKDAGDIPVGLSVAAAACGFSDFNWQQEIDFLPAPSTWRPFTPSVMNQQNLSPDGSLQAPPPFSDPPPGGGYTYENGNDSAFPFYWNFNELASGLVPCAGGTQIKTIIALSFQDCPGDSLLPRGAAVQFKTSLVGIRPCPVGATGCQTGIPSDPLYTWKWKSTFNGISTGGVSQSKSIFPIDPTSGTGGITITSINGVPQTPPSVSCMASPNTFWPPDGKPVLVTVSGNVTPGTQAVIPGSSTFTVADSQGETQPSGSIIVGSDGSYSFTVPLVAARDGSSQNDRRYAIVVSANDEIGNQGSCSTVVVVPHDQGQ